ncbi:hypothetical protein ACHAXA_005766 [Cyclostephanos tholiformis]|uniref:FAD-binding domain-containing protein n=1 Tax=Cyclostephanos tholiformis TaxID=382380 RepID=A0ABD3RSR0_9STRA
MPYFTCYLSFLYLNVRRPYVIGADGKWSRVRRSVPSLIIGSRIIACPSFGVHMNPPTVPVGFRTDGTYISSSSSSSDGGFSISVVCYDETLARYPWLDRRLYNNRDNREYGDIDDDEEEEEEEEEGGGARDNRYCASSSRETETASSDKMTTSLSRRLRDVFREEMPEFLRINRRTTWLRMSSTIDGGGVAHYSTADGKVALIGDAAHAMTPSMGEGCNYALERTVRLVDSISTIMKERGEITCKVDTLSEGFVRYGSTRPIPVISSDFVSKLKPTIEGALA